MEICEKCGGEIQGFYHHCRPDRKNVRVSDSGQSAGSVAVWDCPCGYSFHVGVKICKKCGNPQPLQND